MIILEIALIVYLWISATAVWFYVVLGVSLLASLAAFLHLLNKDTNPEYKISWSVIIIIMPLVGTLLYLLFYNRRMSRRESKLLVSSISEMKCHGIFSDEFDDLSAENTLAIGKAQAIINDDVMAEVYRGTCSKYFDSGEDYFESLISDIKTAKRCIFLEYYIIEEGKLWNKIYDILVDKAMAGLDVRVLYDDIGCMRTLPPYYEVELRKQGIKAHRFARVNPRVSSVHHNRDHRKICVIDGNIGYTGGVNVADEYVNAKERFGHWKDGGIRLEGSAVCGLTKLFLSTWDVTSKSISDYSSLLSLATPSENTDYGYYIPFGSGPAPVYKRPTGKNVFLNLINQAKRYVYITTPYLIIDYDLTESLCNAALRGVDVRIITPGIPDKKIIKMMTKSSYPHLMESGVKIYEYAPGFIHEKCFVSDDSYAVVGTINFDYRSFAHNFENAIWMYETPTVLDVKEGFGKTLKLSEKVDREHSKLTFLEWVFRNGVKLFAPLL